MRFVNPGTETHKFGTTDFQPGVTCERDSCKFQTARINPQFKASKERRATPNSNRHVEQCQTRAEPGFGTTPPGSGKPQPASRSEPIVDRAGVGRGGGFGLVCLQKAARGQGS